MSESPRLYQNQYPDWYPDELDAAKSSGSVIALCPGADFDAIAARSDQLVYVVTEERRLIVALRIENGVEIRHPVLAQGLSVLAAGELDIVVSGQEKIVIRLTNRSGHYRPGHDCLDVAADVLTELGFTVDPSVIERYEED